MTTANRAIFNILLLLKRCQHGGHPISYHRTRLCIETIETKACHRLYYCLLFYHHTCISEQQWPKFNINFLYALTRKTQEFLIYFERVYLVPLCHLGFYFIFLFMSSFLLPLLRFLYSSNPAIFFLPFFLSSFFTSLNPLFGSYVLPLPLPFLINLFRKTYAPVKSDESSLYVGWARGLDILVEISSGNLLARHRSRQIDIKMS